MRREAARGISLQNRQKGAAGTRRHLTYNDNNKLLREGAGGRRRRAKKHVSSFSLSPPLPHPLITVVESVFLFACR